MKTTFDTSHIVTETPGAEVLTSSIISVYRVSEVASLTKMSSTPVTDQLTKEFIVFDQSSCNNN